MLVARSRSSPRRSSQCPRRLPGVAAHSRVPVEQHHRPPDRETTAALGRMLWLLRRPATTYDELRSDRARRAEQERPSRAGYRPPDAATSFAKREWSAGLE